MTVVSERSSPDGIDASIGKDHTSRRRTATKNVSYNEKEADVALAKKIKQLEKAKTLKSKSEKGDTAKKNGINKKSQKGKKLQKSGFKYQSFLQDKNTSWNFIPSLPTSLRKYARFSTTLDIDEMTVDVSKQLLISVSSTVLKQNEHIFMISEPPGEPYYVGRIVEFVPRKEFRSFITGSLHTVTTFPAKFFQLKMNWYYRPRDIQERTNTTSSRMLYASLHNDVCPISSYRGKCNVKFQKEFTTSDELAEFVSKPNCFYFNQLFDRFTLKYYQLERTDQLATRVGLDVQYFKVLSKKFPYIFYEEKFPLDSLLQKYICGKRIEDRDWDLRCGECREWCQSSSSIRCDDCGASIHLWCMDPPLEKKPAKSVIWICSNCVDTQNNEKSATKDKEWEMITTSIQKLTEKLESSADLRVNKENWWFQYLGEDMCNHLAEPLFDDYIAPFPWKKSRVSSQKGQWSNCSQVWKPEPYSDAPDERGGSESVENLWILKDEKITDDNLNEYVRKCQAAIPASLGVQPEACNFMDLILNLLMDNDFDPEISFQKALQAVTRGSLKEPTLSSEEISKFEEGVKLYGSELHPVCKHVGTQPMSMIVRYYYHWKKTANGRRIWGNFKGRAKNRKKQNNKESMTNKVSDIEKDDRDAKRIVKKKNQSTEMWKHIDDSSFDSEQISNVKKCFQCMFCSLDYSPLWYRVTGGSEDDHVHLRLTTGVNEKVSNGETAQSIKGDQGNGRLNALCIRCARMWRRYGVRWSSPTDVLKQLHGNSSSSLQIAITELLEQNDEQVVVHCSTKQVFSKNLEWELVIDAESIIKQRYTATKNPEHLQKMKRNTLSSQAQMNKSVKKLVDLDSMNPERLKQSLVGYISNAEAQIKRKEEKKLKREKERELQEQLISEAHMKKSYKQQELAKKDVDVSSPEIKSQMNESATKQPITPYRNSSVIKKLMPNGEFSVNIEFEPPNIVSNASLTVTPDFSTIKFSDAIVASLRQERDKYKAMEDESFESERKRKKPSPNHSGQNSRFAFNENNIPVVKPFDSPAFELIQMYNNVSPTYSHKVITGRGAKTRHTQKSGDNTLSQATVESHSQMHTQPFPDHKGSILKSDKNLCRACLSHFNYEAPDELSCSNCGMNVHPSCYGIQSNTPNCGTMRGKLWLCDPCSNDRNPIISTNYQCVLCDNRDSMNESTKKTATNSIPYAKKCTANGLWCHILCAIFGDSTKFANLETKQPIIDTECTLSKQNDITCQICNLSGGLIVQCQCCEDKFHPICSADTEGFSLGFRKNLITAMTTPYEVTFMEDQNVYAAKPAIFCPKHSNNPEYVSFNYRIKYSNILLLELFIRKQKSDPQLGTSSFVQLCVYEHKHLETLLSQGEGSSDINESATSTPIPTVQTLESSSRVGQQLLSLLKVKNELQSIPEELKREREVELPIQPPRVLSSQLISSIDTSFMNPVLDKGHAKHTQQKETKRIRNKKTNKFEVKIEDAPRPMSSIVVQSPTLIANKENGIITENS
ncbi:unnamed protein product [Kluyveromyces dobzhanskii CBS 2104]|uniref:WGS project CCBQ000000000 data, contig 00016 n=1 Tax=Kluyveromyces dobzhanskii CBS 2104 TaxID=1427455 RepID=A0A0A8L1N0_9SACH|nr:unnamed protein product [Kluyveromyces dobzhanskii CBS 2104]